MLLTDFPIEILQTVINYVSYSDYGCGFHCENCGHKCLAKLCIALHGIRYFRPKLVTAIETLALPDTIKVKKYEPNWLDMFITKRNFQPDMTFKSITEDDIVTYVKTLVTNERACSSLTHLKLHYELVSTNILNFLHAFTNLRILETDSRGGSVHANIICQLPNLTQLNVQQIDFDDNQYCFPKIIKLELSRYNCKNTPICDALDHKFPNLEVFSLGFAFTRDKNYYIFDIGNFTFLRYLKVEDNYDTDNENKHQIRLGVLNFLEKMECGNIKVILDKNIFYPCLNMFKMKYKISDLTNLGVYPNLEVRCEIFNTNDSTISALKTIDHIHNLTLKFYTPYKAIDLDAVATLNVKKLILFQADVRGSLCNITSLTSLSVRNCLKKNIYEQFVEYIEKFSLQSATFSSPQIPICVARVIAKVPCVNIIPPILSKDFWEIFCRKHQELIRNGKPACQTIKCYSSYVTPDFITYAGEAGIKLCWK
jgi:hypothetical protein